MGPWGRGWGGLDDPREAVRRGLWRPRGPEDALWEISEHALARETGARGLRSIIELALLDVMFELPSRTDVTKCVITKETISKGLKPTLVTSAGSRDDELDELAEETA